MADLVPVPANPQGRPGSILSPLTEPAGGPALDRLRRFAGQDAVRRMLPWFLGVSAVGAAALAWSTLAPSTQRTLYTQLDDGERASVTAALDQAAIHYRIDNATGALSVDEDDYYRARMLVASNHAIAVPESGAQLLDSLPLGASRTLEGERLREARQQDLQLTIMQIDGVEAVRVHLAEAEKSAFVRDDTPPSASVMVRLSRGRSLSPSQVTAIANLVAASVPGLSADAVRVVDQAGRLLSDPSSPDGDRLALQERMEDKLRAQVSALLTPMLGDAGFSSEIQVDLDMDQVTSARESYDKDGVVRSETEQQSQQTGAPPAAGVPGVLSNTPPPPTTARAGPPQGTAPAAPAAPVNTDSSTQKTYELGREVSVANASPGKIKRLSVAVAVSSAALKGKPADLDQIKSLVSAAVGADASRGDQVAVVIRGFQPLAEVATPFYQSGWFAMLVRYGAALLAVLLVLLLGVRPLVRALRVSRGKALDAEGGGVGGAGGNQPAQIAARVQAEARMLAAPVIDGETGRADTDLLSRKIGLAQRLVEERPDSALAALRHMLAQPSDVEPAA